MARQSIIGKVATVTNRNSWHYGDWGVVQYMDDDGYYGLAMFGDKNDVSIFARDEIRVSKKA